MKPIQIALFIVLIMSVLFGFMFLSEKGAIKNNIKEEDGFYYKGISLKYPTYTTFLGLEKKTSASKQDILEVTKIVVPIEEDIDAVIKEGVENNSIVGFNDGFDEDLSEDIDETDEEVQRKDSIANFNKNKKLLPDFSKIDTTRIVRIKYPKSNPDFADELRKKLASKSCRILHYGDSQIEGDRITGYLRNRLQGMYGGSGPGFIPVKPVYNQISAIVEPCEKWKRYAFFDPTQEKFTHKKYGTYLSISRFTEYQEKLPDSATLDTLPIIKASVLIGKSKRTYIKFRNFTNIKLHYGNCKYPIKVSVYNNDKLIQQDSLITDGKYHNYEIEVVKTPTNLKIELEGKISADFYGLTLDGKSKVQIDNIAMRGASGTIFASTSASCYSGMVKVLNPKVVIMQYGGNTIPYLKDSLKVDNYAKTIANQINWIRRRTEDVNFIFIGPTDMCLPVNGKMETYPLLPYLNEKLKESCLLNNVAYWSMYEAMGGKGSMPFWVEEKLAGTDYMHFTPKGTKIISELFFTALYLDLKESKKNDT